MKDSPLQHINEYCTQFHVEIMIGTITWKYEELSVPANEMCDRLIPVDEQYGTIDDAILEKEMELLRKHYSKKHKWPLEKTFSKYGFIDPALTWEHREVMYFH